MLDNLVKENKLAKKDDSYYIPGLETYEALQKENIKKTEDDLFLKAVQKTEKTLDVGEEKPILFIDEIEKNPLLFPENVKDRPGLEDEKLPEEQTSNDILNKIKVDELPSIVMKPDCVENIAIFPQKESLKKNKQQKKPVTFAGVRISQLFVIKVILVLMLITSVLIEMSYNIENFVLMMGPVKGTLTGIALVIYDCIAISLIIYVLKMKIFYKGDKIFKVLKTIITKGFITALLTCLFLGVFYILQVNIMQGLFDKFQDQLFAKKTQVENKSLILLNRYEKEEKELEAELLIRITNRDKLQAALQTIEDIDSREYKNTNYRLAVANNDIDKRRNYLQKKRSEIDTIYKENNTVVLQEKLNFFDLVSINVFKNVVKSNWLQIVQVFFPALIFNLISSAAMGLILFLKE
jgi:hypothetical protein